MLYILASSSGSVLSLLLYLYVLFTGRKRCSWTNVARTGWCIQEVTGDWSRKGTSLHYFKLCI